MRLNTIIKWFVLIGVICVVGLIPALSSAQSYESLKGVDSVKVIFDFRQGASKSALAYLKLIKLTYNDKAITKLAKKPEFAVVFMGKAVTLLSKERKGSSADEAKRLEEIANLIAAMAKQGVRFEICLFAARHFGVSPQSILPDIHQVDNGWIASAGAERDASLRGRIHLTGDPERKGGRT
ncbi:MAG: DsrE family protein [Deltaproteobacteria bacterium]